MSNDKIYVESLVSDRVGFQMPGSTIVKMWEKKGTKLSFKREELIEAYYIPGVEYFFTHGILYTDDMEFKKEVGLEPEDAEEPVNVVKLDDNLMHRMIGPMPLVDFETEIKKLSYDQRQELIGYIVDHPSELKFEKVDIIDKACSTNILKVLEIQKAMAEDTKEQ